MYYITINVQYVRYSTGRKIKYFIVLSFIVTPTVLAIVAGITGINIHCSNWLEFMLQLRKFILSHEFIRWILLFQFNFVWRFFYKQILCYSIRFSWYSNKLYKVYPYIVNVIFRSMGILHGNRLIEIRFLTVWLIFLYVYLVQRRVEK